jgi:hypothetical protein
MRWPWLDQVYIVTLHEKAAKKAARKKAKQEAKAAAAAEAARLQAEKQAAFAAKRKAQEQAERARQDREAAAEAAQIAAEEEARRLAEEQAKERARLAAEKEANRRAALTGRRATLDGLIAATGERSILSCFYLYTCSPACSPACPRHQRSENSDAHVPGLHRALFSCFHRCRQSRALAAGRHRFQVVDPNAT